jgi:hypothetical protein
MLLLLLLKDTLANKFLEILFSKMTKIEIQVSIKTKTYFICVWLKILSSNIRKKVKNGQFELFLALNVWLFSYSIVS